jgi:hypothetical protein
MQPRPYRSLLLAALLAPVIATAAAADVPKQLPDRSAAVRLLVQPGETVRWRSPRVGEVRRMYVRINGGPATYKLVPGTRNCVAYIYGAGVVVRLTDCHAGRRVPYVRVRAVSAALKPVAVRLRLN